jgi:3-methylfumaryl-CoA hydratase
LQNRIDLAALRDWVGREEIVEDGFELPRAQQLAATLNRDPAALVIGAVLPPLWHWIYGTPAFRLDQSGADGHAKRGGFLPPVPLPRRMWAAGRFAWNRLPRLGEAYRRTSRVESVELKEGKSGTLVFVGVQHEIEAGGELALTEWHDIVYRDLPAPGAAPVTGESARSDETRATTLVPDDVLLFRYSALTFNSHRIHYDRRYCVEEEGYPGLVVHGPLMATLLATQAWDEAGQRTPRSFDFRARSPVFDGTPMAICTKSQAKQAETWVRAAGRVALDGAMQW